MYENEEDFLEQYGSYDDMGCDLDEDFGAAVDDDDSEETEIYRTICQKSHGIVSELSKHSPQEDTVVRLADMVLKDINPTDISGRDIIIFLLATLKKKDTEFAKQCNAQRKVLATMDRVKRGEFKPAYKSEASIEKVCELYANGHTQSDIAATLGISISTVKRRLHEMGELWGTGY